MALLQKKKRGKDAVPAEAPAPADLEMTPYLAFIIALLYTAEADGEAEESEIRHLMEFVGRIGSDGVQSIGDEQHHLVAVALAYVENNEPEAFLAQAKPVLNMKQRLFILLNMLENALADGEAEPGEEELIQKFQESFEISDAVLEPYFKAIFRKNDKSVLFR